MTSIERISDIFALCESAGASDIHVTTGERIHIRIGGRIMQAANAPVYSAEEMDDIAKILLSRVLLPGVNCRAALLERGAIDGSIDSQSGKRYRFNVFLANDNIAIAFRMLDDKFRSYSELGLPSALGMFANVPDGLAVITGPTGSGKTTTLASIIDDINCHRSSHIVTIEDPIEYVHHNNKSLIHQRQVGRDAVSFGSALVEALRQDPDVILVGEIRQLDTIRTALTAAETGHLVFTTLHAGDCIGAIERLVSVFPADEQVSIRRQLSLILRGVFAQHLLPRIGGGRVPAGELLLNSVAVANLIATEKPNQIYTAMELGTTSGMQTLEQDLVRLCATGQVEERVALPLAKFPDSFRDRLRRERIRIGGGLFYGK